MYTVEAMGAMVLRRARPGPGPHTDGPRLYCSGFSVCCQVVTGDVDPANLVVVKCRTSRPTRLPLSTLRTHFVGMTNRNNSSSE